MELIAELTGLTMGADRPHDVRYLRDRDSGEWRIEITNMITVGTDAAQAREFALACRKCLTAGPGDYEAPMFFDDPHEGWMDVEVNGDGELELDLGMNLHGAVSIGAPGFDRDRLGRFADAILEATDRTEWRPAHGD